MSFGGQIGSCGGTTAIIRAMAEFPSHPELQGEACTAVTNLSHNCDRNRRLVVEGGGLVLILNAMQASNNSAVPCCVVRLRFALHARRKEAMPSSLRL